MDEPPPCRHATHSTASPDDSRAGDSVIIDRYLIRLVLFPTLAGFALLILLVSAFNAAALLRDAAYSRIPMNQVFTLIGLRDLIAAEVLLPTSLYMGVLTTLNQWHREREALRALWRRRAARTHRYPVWLIALDRSARASPVYRCMRDRGRTRRAIGSMRNPVS